MNVAGDIVALRPGDGKLLWRSAHYGFTCQPVIDQGIAYAISGTDSVSVVALRASDGKELWLSDPMIASNPTLRAVNGVVYFSNSTYHQGQTPAFSAPAVMAFRGSDGHLLWQHPFNAPDQADNQIVSAPVVANGKVYIGAGTALFALCASDGKELWAIATNLYDLSSQEKMTVTGDSVYLYMEEPATIGPNPKPLGNTDAHLAALGANSISQRWLVNMGLTIRVLGADVIDAPVVADGVVYVGLGSQPDASGQTQNVTLLALRASDGKQLWSYQSPPVPASDGLPLASGPFLAAGALYYSSGSGSVSAVRVSDHTPLWQHQAAASGGAVILAATDQALFVQTSNAILALRPADGATLWQQNVGE